ncbi:tRNA splicing endonuclease subunit 54 [Xylocopa sonorina]|uniref:tRNA splicing endonuclease subunit 54 n=1 Tax=Xylocopa sonorina TaxID=1818115 RepID=UPI00403ACDE7
MTEETKNLPANMLTAEELLENKGLKYNAWDQYEKSAKSLPKTGMKQFEPNDSWLQNMQIEKGIMTRKNLIAIERVDRISQLASAEWLPTQRRARVKKYSGQDWNSFGLEKSGALYLIPEEALFLLEANCLELTWNDVPLSIQQAYELLIDNVECSLEEYRVYSQLVKHGYRIQRFICNIEKNAKSDESITIKRKVIVEPENGLWMTDSQQQNKNCTNTNGGKLTYPERIDTDISNSSTKICQDITENKDLLNSVYEVVDDLLNAVENIEAQYKDVKCERNTKNEGKLNTNLQNVEVNGDKKKKKSEVKIISDETLLGNIKIVINHTGDFTKGSKISPSWRASRIQRNVKLVPRRTDKLATPDASDSSNKDIEHSPGKHKSTSPPKEDSQIKKSKQEVIELSDDEIHEVPKPMMRMDLLNMIPNIAFQSTVTIKISRGYIPHSIKPYKTTYYYECANLKRLHEKDNKFRSRQNVECTNNANNNTRRNTNISQFNQNPTSLNSLHMQDPFFMQHGQYTNFGSNYVHNSRFPYTYSQNFYWHLRNTMFQNVHVAVNNHSTSIYQNRYMSMQMHNLSIPNISNNMIRNEFVQNQFHQNFHQNMPLRRLHHQRVFENTSIHSNIARNVLLPDSQPRYWNRHKNMYASRKDEVYRSSFKILPGASSWSELKSKWREEKTITIDDEDTRKDTIEDCNEVQVVGQSRSSLVGPKNANSLEEVFNKLQIIKSAPEKIARRKKSKYKISYNVYSNTQAYKKANPGLPFYRIVVIRQDDSFIQPIELHRLMQDSGSTPILLACVSMSISYIQPGFISMPNLT